jgi:hypothetical protein
MKGFMSIGITAVTIFVCVLTTAITVRDRWEALNLYILLDNIFLAQVASGIGFVGLLLVIYNG